MDEPLSPEVMNAALRMSLEMGENHGKRVDERLLLRFPTLTAEQAEQADLDCRGVRRSTFRRCEKIVEGKFSETSCRETTLEIWPWIDAENLAHLFSQGMYFARRG